jgi:ubiquinone/menaquinone biosynthesis C-methylase UbiE
MNINTSVQELYDNWAKEWKKYARKTAFDTFDLTLFKNFFKKNDLILDLCCGSGRHLKFLKDIKCKTVGVDFSRNMIKISHKIEKKLVLEDITESLPFSQNCFDGVTIIWGLGWIMKKRKFLTQEIFRVLKDGGIVIAEVPNRFFPLFWVRHFQTICYDCVNKKYKPKEGDLRYVASRKKGETKKSIYWHTYTKDEFKNLFLSAGFKEIKIIYPKKVFPMVLSKSIYGIFQKRGKR